MAVTARVPGRYLGCVSVNGLRVTIKDRKGRVFGFAVIEIDVSNRDRLGPTPSGFLCTREQGNPTFLYARALPWAATRAAHSGWRAIICNNHIVAHGGNCRVLSLITIALQGNAVPVAPGTVQRSRAGNPFGYPVR